MALTAEDVIQIQELLETGLMPKIEKMVVEKVAAGVGGIASVAQGILSDNPEGGAAGGKGAEILATVATIGGVLLQLMPLLKGQQQPDPMAQFNNIASMMRTASDVWMGPQMDTFTEGMKFMATAIGVAQKVGQVPDPEEVSSMMRAAAPGRRKTPASSPDPAPSSAAEIARLAAVL